MLNSEDMPVDQTTKDRLAADKSLTDWRSLRPHYKREALFLVDSAIDLVDAAIAVVADDAEQVRAWLSTEQLRRPSEADRHGWEEDPDVCFDYLIVQPYVLATLRSDRPE